MNKKIIITIIILLASIFFIIKFVNNKKQIPSEYPKYRTIEKKSYILGRFWPIEKVKIKSEISGIIENIYIRIGDSISMGHKIAKIRIIPNPENIELAKRALQITKVDKNQKQINFNRNKKLFDKGVISRVEFERFSQDLKNAEIEYNYAVKNYNIALKGFSAKNESRNIIKSTINGTVIDIPVKVGMNITQRNNFNEGNTIAVVANMKKFIFEFNIGETDVNHIHINDTFEIAVKAFNSKHIKAKVIELKPSSASQKEKFSYLAKARLLNNNLTIKPGFSGLAEFLLESKANVLSVKEKNIIYKGSKSFVEIVKNKDVITKVEITRGISDGIYTEIKKGISKIDRVKSQ